MKIGILGTGMVGQTLAGKLASLGHEVVIGTRDPKATLTRDGADAFGNPPFRAWQASHAAVKLATFAEAARHAEIAVAALAGHSALAALRLAGDDNLANKILIDVTNPLDFSKGMPPSLFVCNTDSLGEQIQKALPRVKVVKALNTVSAPVMIAPNELGAGEHTIFVSGNDAEARSTVARLLKEWFGWKDVLDFGDISMARGSEMHLALWIRLYGLFKTPMVTIRVVR